MKRVIFALTLLVIFSISLFPQSKNDNDIKAIKNVVQKAYVDGILNLGNISDIEKGFHPGFISFYTEDNHLIKRPIYTWIEMVEQRKKDNPNGRKDKYSIKFLIVEAIGNTGIARYEIYLGSKHRLTDCFMLLKFEEGWRIVAKISHYHAENW